MISFFDFIKENWILDNRFLKIKAIIKACDLMGLPMLEQKAYIMATNQHETAGTMQPVREAFFRYDSKLTLTEEEKFQQAEAWRKKNLRYYPWYGRGDVQLTHKYNYEKYKLITGVDIIANPDEMITNKPLSLYVMIHGMATGNFNGTGEGLMVYINDKMIDLVNARRTVNVLNLASEIAGLSKVYLAQLQRGLI